MLNQGDILPKIILENQNANLINLHEVKENILLYFYPKDDTSGCTTESIAFADIYNDLQKLDVKIFGISKDSVKSHLKFCSKYNFPFDLLSDENIEVCSLFGVWKEKSMYGKKYMGISRQSFFIDKNKKIIKIWEKVNPKDHAQEVLQFVQDLQNK